MSIEKFLVDRNIVRNKKQAEGIMIAVIILCLIVIGINIFGGRSPKQPELSPEEIEQFESEFGTIFPAETTEAS